MKLYATATPNTRRIKQLEVYDNDGLAFIRKTLPTDGVFEWQSPDRTPAEWVALNSGPRQGWQWTLV